MYNSLFKEGKLTKLTPWIGALLIVVVTVLSLLPEDEIPKVNGNDKLHHFIAYFSIILVLCFAKFNLALKAAPAIVLYSGLIELIQPMTNRHAEWADFGVNALGVIVGLFVGKIVDVTRFKLTKKDQNNG